MEPIQNADGFSAAVEAANASHAALLEDNAAAAREEAERNRPPAVALGRLGRSYVFYSPSCGDIFEYPPDKLNNAGILLTMAPLEHWESWLFPDIVNSGEHVSKKVLLDAAQARLLADSRGKHFDPDKVRARGVWADSPDGWIYNAGASCWHIPANGGKPERVGNMRGKIMYSAGVELPEPSEAMLTDSEGLHLLELLTARTWRMQGSGELLAGWLVSSLLAGITPIRPHIWVNASPGTGKTFLRDEIGHIIRDFALIPNGVPTEAAIRQHRKGDCLPVVLDEVEPDEDEAKEKKILGLLELMRSASYSGKVIRGTKEGVGVSYLMKCNFALFSISNAINREADASRCIVLQLFTPRDKVAKKALWQRQEAGRKLIKQDDFHGRLIARLLETLPAIMRNIEELTEFLSGLDGVDSRRASIFAVLMACRHALTSRELMTAEEMNHAAMLARAYDQSEEKESDFSRCLNILCSHQVEVMGAGKMTVARACIMAKEGTDAEARYAAARALELYGLRWRDDKNALQVYTGDGKLKRVYKGTPWASGKISPVLMDGGQGCYQMSGNVGSVKNRRCLFIPAALILDE